MKPEEYVKTFNINGHEIKLGLDDYGQCYFIEWVDDLGNTRETGLGTYNFRYMEDIYYLFDPHYKELARKNMFGDLTDKDWNELRKYDKMFEEEYKEYKE